MVYIKLENATKAYGGEKVLDGINLSFESGKIYGLVGRNGSGKTLLLKSILGFLSIDEGFCQVDDKVIGKDIDFAQNTGFIIETPGFMGRETGFNNLKFLAKINNKIGDEEIRRSIEKVGLDPDSKKKVSQYSMGMKQRLAIAQATMEDPAILILDEPMNGLDNERVLKVRDLLLELKEAGKLIILASHNKEDIDVLCDEIIRIDKGSIIKRSY